MEENTIDQDDSGDDNDPINHQPPNSRHDQSCKDEWDDDPTYNDIPSDGCVVVKGVLKVYISLSLLVFNCIYLLTSVILL